MKNLNKIAILLSVITYSMSGYSTPKKYNHCDLINNIKHPSKSDGLYFDKECKTAYVLPPQLGVLSVAGLSSSISPADCNIINGSVDLISDEVSQIKETQKNIHDRLRSTSPEIDLIQTECDTLDEKKEKTFEAKQEVVVQKELLQNQLNFLVQEKEKCEAEGRNRCNKDDMKVRSIEKKLNKIEQILLVANSQLEADEHRLNYCVAKLERKRENFEKRDAELKRLYAELEAIVDSTISKHKQLIQDEGSVPGATFGVTIETGHQQLVGEYQKLNPNSAIQFVKIPIKKAEVNFSLITDGIDAGYPVVMKSKIQGLRLQSKDTQVPSNQLVTDSEMDVNSLFGTSASGKVTINRLATCRLMQGAVGFSLGKIAETIKPVVHYNYELQTDRRINVKYNESHLYQLIKKNSKRGGFFRTSAVSSVTQKSEAEKWIQIDLQSQDADHGFVDPIKMADDIRKEFADAALMKVAKAYITNQEATMMNPDGNGASQASGALKKCPHIYCQYAGIALDIGNAVFGGSTSEANMTKIVKASEGFEIHDQKMIPHAGTFTFQVVTGDNQ